ncbi:MAG: hypothetical protein L0Y72_07470 [Gemmataceae bacterium]|nr:hypothetical protein [Gemmataceae bacterium]MCI0738867.1 hypothetical protein [Gemmataceae bacterium]
MQAQTPDQEILEQETLVQEEGAGPIDEPLPTPEDAANPPCAPADPTVIPEDGQVVCAEEGDNAGS